MAARAIGDNEARATIPVAMQVSRLALLAALQLALSADTQIPPAIDPGSLVNAASRMPSSLPGGALARGARFSLSGVRLGPHIAVRGSESDPPAMLGDVSVQIIQGQNRVSAGILYASATRIDGVIPESAPLGPVHLVVIYNGVSSEPYGATLVSSSFGFFTPATAPEHLPLARQPVSATPEQRVELWGSGLGDAKPEIFLAGQPVAATATAEACCQGVNRIEFQVPAGSPLGCYVPVQVSAGGRASNVAPIAIHVPGQACTDQFGWFEKSVQQATRAGFAALVRVSVALDAALKMGGYQFDYAVAAFGDQHTGQRPFPPLPPMGSCTASSARVGVRRLLSQARDPSAWTGVPEAAPGSRSLDAGPQISISGPDGLKVLRRQGRQRNAYSAVLGGAVPFSQIPKSPLFLAPGSYQVSSSGGKDIGAFDVPVTVERAIEWKNRERLSEVKRAGGVTLEWKEARPDDAVLIAATGSDAVTGDSSLCVCLALAKNRRFTIPPLSLANIPATKSDDPEPNLLLIVELPLEAPPSIQAQGLDTGFAAFLSASARMVKFR